MYYFESCPKAAQTMMEISWVKMSFQWQISVQ